MSENSEKCSCNSDPIAALPEVMDVKQVAQLMNVNPNTVYYLLGHKRIPCRRIGKEYRFVKSVIMKWMSSDGGAAA